VPVLDRYGVIFVTAARSGNDESALGRREPLALLAAHNIIKEHPVDPERIFVAGFSGGSRIALRLALGYPDLFRGAILNAGSDSIGNGRIPLPPKDVFLQFQSSTHLIYITGDRDADHIVDDMSSVRSMHKWCVFNVDDYVQPHVGHEVAGAPVLFRALDGLLNISRSDSNKLAACRSTIDSDLEKKFQRVQSLKFGGHRADADKLLIEIDEHYGGLAAPRSVDLAPVDLAPK
jgi:poly(3-hydroxybutyrate) depolymerase